MQMWHMRIGRDTDAVALIEQLLHGRNPAVQVTNMFSLRFRSSSDGFCG
jgi:hypothetical protein